MGKHHKATYDWMAKEFGEENSFIVTGDKVRPDSPLTFAEKQQVAQAMGIPGFFNQKKNCLSPLFFIYGRTDATEYSSYCSCRRKGYETFI